MVSTALLLVALGLVFVRAWRGPSPIDRVLALDLATGVALALIVLLAIRFRDIVYLDVALALAVVGFVGTAALARWIAKGGEKP